MSTHQVMRITWLHCLVISSLIAMPLTSARSDEILSMDEFLNRKFMEPDKPIYLPNSSWDSKPNRHLWLRPYFVYGLSAKMTPLHRAVQRDGRWVVDTVDLDPSCHFQIKQVRGQAGQSLEFYSAWHVGYGYYTDISPSDSVRWYLVTVERAKDRYRMWGWLCSTDLAGQMIISMPYQSTAPEIQKPLRRLYDLTLYHLKSELESPQMVIKYTNHIITPFHDSLCSYVDSNLVSIRIPFTSTDRYGQTKAVLFEERYSPWNDIRGTYNIPTLGNRP